MLCLRATLRGRRTLREVRHFRNAPPLNQTVSPHLAKMVQKGNVMFEKVFPDGKKVVIENGVVALYNADGSQVTNSNVDYYYEDRGYGRKNDDQVADVFYGIFAG